MAVQKVSLEMECREIISTAAAKPVKEWAQLKVISLGDVSVDKQCLQKLTSHLMRILNIKEHTENIRRIRLLATQTLIDNIVSFDNITWIYTISIIIPAECLSCTVVFPPPHPVPPDWPLFLMTSGDLTQITIYLGFVCLFLLKARSSSCGEG